jgi:hypothetical protein
MLGIVLGLEFLFLLLQWSLMVMDGMVVHVVG